MRGGRVVVFFIAAFASICLPVLLGFLYSILTYKEPYRIDLPSDVSLKSLRSKTSDIDLINSVESVDMSKLIQTEKAFRIDFKPKGHAFVLLLPPTGKAKDYLHPLDWDIETSRITSSGHTLYRRSDNRAYGLLFASGPWLVLSEASTEEGVFNQLTAIPDFIRQKMNAIDADGGAGIKWLFIGIGIYCLILLLTWPRAGSWAATIERKTDTTPVAGELLRKKILAINDMDVPFSIETTKRKNDIVVNWKYADAKWAGLMSAAGIKTTASLLMLLDEKVNKVKVIDKSKQISWSVGAAGTLSAKIHVSFFRGINFMQYHRGFIGGIVFEKDGRPTLDSSYTWNFSLKEMKNPIIEIVTDNGWEWRPVITFLRLFN